MDKIKLTSDQEIALTEIKEWLYREDSFWYKTLMGYAGTGKTTLLDEVVKYCEKTNLNVICTATTNKAVKVLRDRIDHYQFSTIHSLLNIKPKRKGSKEVFEPIKFKMKNINAYDVIIVDECSMISEKLLRIIDDDLEDGTKVLFCGDPAQLQPINETKSKCFEFDPVKLTEVVRHGDSISRTAKLVRETNSKINRNDLITPPDIVSVGADEVKEMFKGFRDDPDNVRFLCWTNKRVDDFNSILREVDYGHKPSDAFEVDDIVIADSMCKIGKEVVMMNADEGRVKRVNETETSWELDLVLTDGSRTRVNVVKEQYKPTLEQKLKEYADKAKKPGQHYYWKNFWELKDRYHDIRHCYAMTTHKSQGSTFKNVVVDFTNISRNIDLYERNQLLYVAMTRASEKVMIF